MGYPKDYGGPSGATPADAGHASDVTKPIDADVPSRGFIAEGAQRRRDSGNRDRLGQRPVTRFRHGIPITTGLTLGETETGGDGTGIENVTVRQSSHVTDEPQRSSGETVGRESEGVPAETGDAWETHDSRIRQEAVLYPSESGKEGRKPVRLVFGEHFSSDVENLGRFGHEIEGILATREQDQVAVFVEAADMTRGRSKKITERVNNGWLPSEAFIVESYDYYAPHAQQIARSGSKGTVEQVRAWIQSEDYQIKYPFTREQYRVLDEIAGANPGRILLVAESNNSFKANFEPEEHPAQRGIHYLVNLAARGIFRTTEFRNNLFKFFEESRNRELFLQKNMQDILMRDTVIGAVSYSGPGHAGLQADVETIEDCDVVSVFPEAENEAYVFTPLQSALIQRRGYSEGVDGFLTRQEAKIILAQTVIWSFFSQTARRRETMTEQQVRAIVLNACGNFTIDDADAFEMAIQTHGFSQAMKHVFAKVQ